MWLEYLLSGAVSEKTLQNITACGCYLHESVSLLDESYEMWDKAQAELNTQISILKSEKKENPKDEAIGGLDREGGTQLAVAVVSSSDKLPLQLNTATK